jgi:hypothetical protein
MRRRWIFLGLMGGLLACRDPFLLSSDGTLFLAPEQLDFGTRYPNTTGEQMLLLGNSGHSALSVTYEAPPPPFEMGELPDSVPVGGLTLVARFHPLAVGRFQGRWVVHSGSSTALLELQGSAQPTPSCPQPLPCHTVRFDLEREVCEEDLLPDGESCDPHSVCLESPTCQQGRCLGSQKSCDDQNACTTDLCDAELGCQHLVAPPCPGNGNCQRGVCDPVTGCGLVAAPEGSACGSIHSCDTAQVCIGGACVLRDPPDGFVCAPASPCQPEGRCTGSECLRAPPTPLHPDWSLDTRPESPDPLTLHDLLVEPDGAISLFGFFTSPPIVRANTPGSKRLGFTARRCIGWNDRLLCADYPSTLSGVVSSVDPATGAIDWTFDLPSQRPDWVRLVSPGRLFLARLVSLGSDRLAAIYEGYPAGKGGDTQCRLYFLVTLDQRGAMASATQLADPALELCNHPHPFGVAADAAGALYLAFSPTPPGGAPLPPESPTLLMAYSRDGLLRWKRSEPITGGELAVAQGLLYPENSQRALFTDSGQLALKPIPSVFGRPVVTLDRFLPGPRPGSTQLTAYASATGAHSWTYAAPPGQVFLSDQLRLAGWKALPDEPAQTVALLFVSRGDSPWLAAINSQDGSEAWSCPVAQPFPGPPQLFEVSNRSIAVMEVSNQCGQCDPPYANSRASFISYPLPGIEQPRAPWTGTWGGPNHDHREDATGLFGNTAQ